MSDILKEMASRARNSINGTSTGDNNKLDKTSIGDLSKQGSTSKIDDTYDKLMEILSSRNVINAISVLAEADIGLIRCSSIVVKTVKVARGITIGCDWLDAYNIPVYDSLKRNIDLVVTYDDGTREENIEDYIRLLDKLNIRTNATVVIVMLFDIGSITDKEYSLKLSRFERYLNYGNEMNINILTNIPDNNYAFTDILTDLFAICRCVNYNDGDISIIQFKSPNFRNYDKEELAKSTFYKINNSSDDEYKVDISEDEYGNFTAVRRKVSQDRKKPLIEELNGVIGLKQKLEKALSTKEVLLTVLKDNDYKVSKVGVDVRTLCALYSSRVLTDLQDGSLLDAFNFVCKDEKRAIMNVCIFYTTAHTNNLDEILTAMSDIKFENMENLCMLGLFDGNEWEEYGRLNVTGTIKKKYLTSGEISCIIRTNKINATDMLQSDINNLFELFRDVHKK